MKTADTVVVHLLGEDQVDVAKTFSTSGIDRFADTSTWSRLETGEPYLPSAATWMRGKVVSQMEAGDSTIVAVEVLQVSLPNEGEGAEDPRPLVYHNRTWHTLSAASAIE